MFQQFYSVKCRTHKHTGINIDKWAAKADMGRGTNDETEKRGKGGMDVWKKTGQSLYTCSTVNNIEGS